VSRIDAGEPDCKHVSPSLVGPAMKLRLLDRSPRSVGMRMASMGIASMSPNAMAAPRTGGANCPRARYFELFENSPRNLDPG